MLRPRGRSRFSVFDLEIRIGLISKIIKNLSMDKTQIPLYNIFIECFDSEEELDFVESLIEENV